MKKRIHFRRVFFLMSTAGILTLSTNTAFAAAYQLWEQDGASVGNYHAGRAAEAADASTAYYNPAGMVRIHSQQLVVGLDPILTDFTYRGSVDVNDTFLPIDQGARAVVAQGGGFNIVPDVHYVSPLNDRFAIGLSVVSPFGLKTDYGTNTFARYSATLTSLQIIDVSPSLSFAATDKLSFGAGLDVEHARAEFDLVAGSPFLDQSFGYSADTPSENVGTDYGYGYHLGVMYQFSEQTRVGLAYHSKITHHLSGTSKFTGQIANGLLGGLQQSNNLKANTTLPATTTLSVFHTFNPTWDMMGTIAYTQWSVLENIVLRNVAGIDTDGNVSNSIIITVPENYRNTWNYSVGANYHLNEQWMFRGGVGYDETPSNNQDRNLQLPDSDRIAVAIGTHYQPTPAWGFDVGWTHFFVKNTRINNLTQQVGAQTTLTDGSISASADVFGLQAKWNIA